MEYIDMKKAKYALTEEYLDDDDFKCDDPSPDGRMIEWLKEKLIEARQALRRD